MGRVVLVTGVAGDLGRRYARRLAEHSDVHRVIGVDVTPPRADIGSMEFVRADIRNPIIAKVIAREEVDTVVHMSVASMPAVDGGYASLKELNVIGTMQLLAACQQAPSLKHLVVKSSSSVYGSTSRDPAMFTEQMTARRLPSSGYPKDVFEVESYVRGFARRRPDVRVTTLRMANVIGPVITSPLTSYFKLPVVPTILGFDARMQFLHEHDAHLSLEHATLADVPGTFNVVGDGTLMLSQCIRRLGRPAVPLPPFGMAVFGGAMKQARIVDFSREQIAFLTYGRGMDATRMRTVLGYEPEYTSEQAFDDFAASVNPGLLNEHRVRSAEQALLGVLAPGGGPALTPDAARASLETEGGVRP